MKLFTYRGQRVQVYHRHFKPITWFILWSPFLFSLAYYVYQHHLELQAQPFPKTCYLVAFALLSALISQVLNWLCYEKLLTFQKLNSLRILSRFLLENNLYLVKKIKREKRTIEKIRLPQVYIKQSR